MEHTIAWMIAGGARLDVREPDARQLAHLVALREAKRTANRGSSPVARLVERLRFQPFRATTGTMTDCCAA